MKKDPTWFVVTNKYIVAANGPDSLYIESLRAMDVLELSKQLSKLGSHNVVVDSVNDYSKLPTKEEYYKESEKEWEKTEWLPFATKLDLMKRRSVEWPEFLVIHWTAGRQTQNGKAAIEYGASKGHTYCFLQADGKLFQGAPTNAGGYHLGDASISSYASLGIEVACAGKVEKIGEKFVPWFAKDSNGKIIDKDCIPEENIIYDGDEYKDDGSFKGYYQKFTKKQKNTLIKIALYSVQVLKIKVENIRGHDEVATPHGRKTDPGASIGEGGMVQFRKDIKLMLDSGVLWDAI